MRRNARGRRRAARGRLWALLLRRSFGLSVSEGKRLSLLFRMDDKGTGYVTVPQLELCQDPGSEHQLVMLRRHADRLHHH